MRLSLGRWLPVAIIVLGGATLVAMAVPRLAAGIALLPGDPVLRRVLERRPASDGQLDRLADSRRDALAWHPRGRVSSDLGLALLLRAERKRIVVAGRDLEPVRRALVEAVALAPANPHAWLRLAAVERALNGSTAAAADFVEMSVLTGPAEREILFPRLLLGLGVWRAGTVQLRDLLLVQMDWAWRAERRRTALLVRAAGAEDALRAMLRKSRPEDLETLDRIVAAAPPPPEGT